MSARNPAAGNRRVLASLGQRDDLGPRPDVAAPKATRLEGRQRVCSSCFETRPSGAPQLEVSPCGYHAYCDIVSNGCWNISEPKAAALDASAESAPPKPAIACTS
jgi:hypothetical protein